MNKRAFLLGDFAIEVLVAAVLLGILLYVGYTYLIAGGELEQAKKSLKLISDAVKQAQELGSFDIMLFNPREWYVIIYHSGNEMPEKCKTEKKSCICICKEKSIESCGKGVCESFDSAIGLGGMAYDPYTPAYEGSFNARESIYIYEVPEELFFKQENDEIKIYSGQEDEQDENLKNFLDYEYKGFKISSKFRGLVIYTGQPQKDAEKDIAEAAEQFFEKENYPYGLRFTVEADDYKKIIGIYSGKPGEPWVVQEELTIQDKKIKIIMSPVLGTYSS